MLAHERQPQPEQAIRALLDGADHGPRPFARVIAERQVDGALERQAHGHQPPPVRQAVSGNRHDDAGQDAEQAQRRPQSDHRKSGRPILKRIHDAPDQNLLRQRDQADRHIGEDEPADQPLLRHQQAQRALIRAPQRHDPSNTCAVPRADLIGPAAPALGAAPLMRSCRVIHAKTTGRNQAVPLNSGTAGGGRKSSADFASAPEDLPRRLLARPARPHHARAAIAGRVAHAVAREDARDHVAVHGDMAVPAVRDVDAVEHGEDVGQRALQAVGRPVGSPAMVPSRPPNRMRVPSGEGR